ncbi:MAG: hypothetical protein CVU81_01510 [Euryarchaeota archaeon HGW-Euryarchaeota-1]|nr:MAG: hypothetical protein CVU81_01510 [Euryarchaeota archaeon HGW-Euryarchaeota-1]
MNSKNFIKLCAPLCILFMCVFVFTPTGFSHNMRGIDVDLPLVEKNNSDNQNSDKPSDDSTGLDITIPSRPTKPQNLVGLKLGFSRGIELTKDEMDDALKAQVEEDKEKGKIEEEKEDEQYQCRYTSDYQYFVTPSKVKSKSSGDYENDYYFVANTYWISDDMLNNQKEKWLYPKEHIENTPSYSTNPTNEIASDCSEQANTLASILRASGVSPKAVRVVLGKVDFGDGEGGHAWVEVYYEGKWIALEATSGPYVDDQGNINKRDPLGFFYFYEHDYPSTELWYYYNNCYFLNPNNYGDDRNNAPCFWTGGDCEDEEMIRNKEEQNRGSGNESKNDDKLQNNGSSTELEKLIESTVDVGGAEVPVIFVVLLAGVLLVLLFMFVRG